MSLSFKIKSKARWLPGYKASRFLWHYLKATVKFAKIFYCNIRRQVTDIQPRITEHVGTPSQGIQESILGLSQLRTAASNSLDLSAFQWHLIDLLILSAVKDSPRELQELCSLVQRPEVDSDYDQYTCSNPEVLNEEIAWLRKILIQAIEETVNHSPWAVIFLVLGFKLILSRKIACRLNPVTEVATPSPFIYAMQ